MPGRNRQFKGFKWRFTDKVENLNVPLPKGAVHIDYWPGHYVTRDGKVYSESHKRFMEPSVKHNGMCDFTISGPKKTTVKLHRLVAEAFLKKPEPYYESVRHKDGNHLNN